MVNAVYVHAPDKSNGHRVQDVTISYNYIGILPANLLYDVMNGKGAVASIKVLIQLFQKLAGSKDGVLGRGSQASKYPRHPKKFLFSLPFFLAKGKKEEMNSLYTKNGCRISEIFP